MQYAIAGTAGFTEHNYVAFTSISASNTTIVPTTSLYSNVTTGFSTFTDMTGNPGGGTFNFMINIRGVVGVGTSGTITPQVTLSGGTAPTKFQVAPGSRMKIYPIGTNTGNLAVGSWS